LPSARKREAVERLDRWTWDLTVGELDGFSSLVIAAYHCLGAEWEEERPTRLGPAPNGVRESVGNVAWRQWWEVDLAPMHPELVTDRNLADSASRR
jgi:hypothetical protein